MDLFTMSDGVHINGLPALAARNARMRSRVCCETTACRLFYNAQSEAYSSFVVPIIDFSGGLCLKRVAASPGKNDPSMRPAHI